MSKAGSSRRKLLRRTKEVMGRSFKEWLDKWSFSLTISFLLLMAIISSWVQLKNFVWKAHPFDSIPQRKWPANDASNTLDDKFEKVFVFLQVSDLHLSVNFDLNRGPDFERWCNQVIGTVKPKVTLVTGDLTDARTKGIMGGEQYRQEWLWYQEIVNRTGVTDKTLWLDLRGNHDDFGVFGWQSDNNYFSKYSVQGRHYKRHYTYSVKDGSETYAFIGVDACLEPGPNRPFNTIGLLHEEDIDSLRALKANTSLQSPNMTIWFGHYPTRSINGPMPGLHNIIDGPYLSGHVHMTNLYQLQPPGFLDIEVADWKTRRVFRVGAVDHSIFSFTDTVLDSWPIIVITNPKPSLFLMPKIEPIERIESSTHIRVLVFSKNAIKEVTVSIDGSPEKVMTRVGQSPLYVYPWDTSLYSQGLHNIRVKARDTEFFNVESHDFSFDGSKGDFSLKSKLIMHMMHQTVWGCAFLIAVWSIVIPLAVLRVCVWTGRCQRLKDRAKEGASCGYTVIVKLFLLCCVNKMFIPVIGLPLYLTFGPWLVGRVIEGHFGTSFVWGTFIEGSYLPGGVSFVLGLVFLVFVHIPFMLTLAHCVHCRFQFLVRNPSATEASSSSFMSKWCCLRHLVMMIVFLLHLFVTVVYGDAYGWIAWVLGFAHTWTLFMNIYVWWSTSKLQLKDFKGFMKNTARVRSPVHVQRREEDSTDLINNKES